MNLDRSGQLELLKTLAAAYPASMDGDGLFEIFETYPEFIACAYYLDEHGLINATFDGTFGDEVQFIVGKITARGLDFLADDGGLTAILGVVTVRLEADTVRQLMEMKIEQSDLPAHEKSRLKEALRAASGEGLKELTRRLVQAGIEHGPNAIQWLSTLTGR